MMGQYKIGAKEKKGGFLIQYWSKNDTLDTTMTAFGFKVALKPYSGFLQRKVASPDATRLSNLST